MIQKIRREELIKKIKEDIIKDGNGDKVYLDFVVELIKKVTPNNVIHNQAEWYEEFRISLFQNKKLECDTYFYLTGIAQRHLDIYFDFDKGFQNHED